MRADGGLRFIVVVSDGNGLIRFDSADRRIDIHLAQTAFPLLQSAIKNSGDFKICRQRLALRTEHDLMILLVAGNIQRELMQLHTIGITK